MAAVSRFHGRHITLFSPGVPASLPSFFFSPGARGPLVGRSVPFVGRSQSPPPLRHDTTCVCVCMCVYVRACVRAFAPALVVFQYLPTLLVYSFSFSFLFLPYPVRASRSHGSVSRSDNQQPTTDNRPKLAIVLYPQPASFTRLLPPFISIAQKLDMQVGKGSKRLICDARFNSTYLRW